MGISLENQVLIIFLFLILCLCFICVSQDSPLILQSDRNVTMNARNHMGQLTGQLTVGECFVQRLFYIISIKTLWYLQCEIQFIMLYSYSSLNSLFILHIIIRKLVMVPIVDCYLFHEYVIMRLNYIFWFYLNYEDLLNKSP